MKAKRPFERLYVGNESTLFPVLLYASGGLFGRSSY
jgi:hypothetical protein